MKIKEFFPLFLYKNLRLCCGGPKSCLIKEHLQPTVKPVLSGLSKIVKMKILKTLMQVKSIAECFRRAFCNTFDLH